LDPILETIRAAVKPSDALSVAIRTGVELTGELLSEKNRLDSLERSLLEEEATALDGSPLNLFSGLITEWVPSWSRGECSLPGQVVRFLLNVGILQEDRAKG
jgi:hypothetical protein